MSDATESRQDPRVQLGYHFTIVSDSLIDDGTLTIYEKMVLVVVCRFAGKDGTAFPSISTIASRAGCGETAVKSAIGALAEKGYLRKEKRKGKAGNFNLYTILEKPQDDLSQSQTVAGRPFKQSQDDLLNSRQATRKYTQEVDTGSSMHTAAESKPVQKEEDILPAGLLEEINRDLGLEGAVDLKGFRSRYTALASRNTCLSRIDYFRSVVEWMRRRGKPLSPGLFLTVVSDEARIREYLDSLKKSEELEARKAREIEAGEAYGYNVREIHAEDQDQEDQEDPEGENLRGWEELKRKAREGNPAAAAALGLFKPELAADLAAAV